jgi:hypothetical protein
VFIGRTDKPVTVIFARPFVLLLENGIENTDDVMLGEFTVGIFAPPPCILVTVTLGTEPVLNCHPEGAFRLSVPVVISPFWSSSNMRFGSPVNVPVPPLRAVPAGTLWEAA